MRKKTLTKLACYVLSLVMVMSCFCITSYGTEVDTQQVDETTNVVVDTDEPTTEPSEEVVVEPQDEPAGEVEGEGEGEGETTPAFDPTAASAKFVASAGGVYSIDVEWAAVTGATGYTVTCNGVEQTTTELTAKFDASAEVTKYTVDIVATVESGTQAFNTITVNANIKDYVVAEAPTVTQVWGTQADNVGKTFKFTEASFKDGYNSHKVVIDNRTTISWQKPAVEPKAYKLLKNGEAPYLIDPTNEELLIVSDTKPTYKEEGDTCTFAYSAKAGTYAYSIVAVYDDIEIESEAAEAVKVPEFLTGAVRTYKFYAKTNKRAKFYKKGKGNSYKCWLPKGVKGTTVGGSAAKFYFEGTSKGSGYVMRAKLSSYKLDYSPKVDWTKTKKEYYVNNSAKFKSSKSRIVWVSRYAQKVNIFKKVNGKWVLERQAECTTGKFRNYTASGSYTIHTRTAKRNRSNYWYRYLSKFNGLNSLHGPTYYKKSLQMKARPSSHLGSYGEWGTLGCVRMWNEDAYWVWNHCPKGTKVVVY